MMVSLQKGNIPLVYIAGHLSKIHGLDWSPHKDHCFVTASNDNTVKVCKHLILFYFEQFKGNESVGRVQPD